MPKSNGQHKKKSNPGSNKQKATGSQGRGEIVNRFHLGNCASMYAESLANPFEGPPGACLPVAPSVKSRKMRVWSKFTAAAGTQGFGFVVAAPAPYNDGVVAASSGFYGSVAYSGPTYPNNIINQNTTVAGVVQTNFNSEYTAASFATSGSVQGHKARLVSCGIRIRYRGTELNRGGRYLCLEEPDHASVLGLDPAGCLAYENCHEFPIKDGSWTSVCSGGPVAPGEYDFLDANANNSSTGGGSTGLYAKPFPYLAIAFESTSGNLFDVEVYANWEVIGPNIRGKTYNEADDVGTSTVLGSFRSFNDSQLDSGHPAVPNKNLSGAMVRATPLQPIVERYAQENSSGWVTQVSGIASTMGGALASMPNPYAKVGGLVLGAAGTLGKFLGHALHK